MIRAVLFILLYLSISLCAQDFRNSRSNIICWHEGVKLQRRDFQANENELDKKSKLYYTSTAYSFCQINVKPIIDEQGKNSFLVNVLFIKNRSWFKDSSSNMTSVILAHEQVHFDIYELIARKLRSKISKSQNLGVDIFSAEFGKEIDKGLDEEEMLNTKYDFETNHGIDVAQQKKWTLYAKAELTKLSAYKSTASSCQQ